MGISVEEYKKLIENKPKRGKQNPNPNRQLQGKMNRELGKTFEEEIQIICDIYELNGLARIEKTPEPMKILKHIDNARFETVFFIRFQVLSDYQREVLLKYNELGAMAFVLVGFTNGRIYKIDINEWINMKEKFGRYYIKQEELEKLNYNAITNKNGLTDFLGIL